MTRSSAIQSFILLARENGTINQLDEIYLRNKLLHLLGEKTWEEPINIKKQDTLMLLTELSAIAEKNGKFSESERSFFASELMDLLTPSPSKINQEFWQDYDISPEQATNYFYQLMRRNNDIQTQAIAKNISYQHPTAYGELEITINLSKPEKDPKQIAAQQQKKQDTNYPQCALCLENEGYYGGAGQAARSNHRFIRLKLNGEAWGFQYSPYAYYPEHAIVINAKHQPMKVDRRCFSNLFAFVSQFPHYMIGSNADLPIVGGSILTHDHYQAGNYEFPMEKAEIRESFVLKDFPKIKAGIVNWPMSVIRLQSEDTQGLIAASDHILQAWQVYSDSSVEVRARDQAGNQHHTITPIVRNRQGQYEINLVLRDNNVSAQYPDGIFHPHPELQHIKKENIGLIEVMGLAILPPRLKPELAEVEKYCLNQPNQIKEMHQAWAEELKKKYTFTAENVHTIIQAEVGEVFLQVLEDAGVFKDTLQGHTAFQRFIQSLNVV